LRTRLGNLGVFFGHGYMHRMSFGKAELAVGTLGSLPACDGQNGACRGGASAMASVRGGSLALVFPSIVGSASPCFVLVRVHVCACCVP
jgi:hypothetical protein